MKSREKVSAVVSALEDIKAENIAVLDVSGFSTLFEWMVIASANSTRQTKALANHVQEKLKELGQAVNGVEGLETGEWVLVDLGDVIVHIMQPAIRQYYNLEGLWSPVPQARAG